MIGTIELTEDGVVLHVNSDARLERGRALLESALGSLVDKPRIAVLSLEEALAASANTDISSGLSPEEERAIVHASMDSHYRKTLDTPLPVLGNATPREVASTEDGRPKLTEWLKSIENKAARLDVDDPTSGYDFLWMWEELGIADLRR